MFTKDWILAELRVVASLTLTLFLVDASGVLNSLWNGDFSKAVFLNIFAILGQSLIRALLTLIAPNQFDHGL